MFRLAPAPHTENITNRPAQICICLIQRLLESRNTAQHAATATAC